MFIFKSKPVNGNNHSPNDRLPIASKLASVGLRASPQSREGLRKVCVALLQNGDGLKYLPSLRGDVNKVDRGELLTLKIKNLELKIKSTPSSAKADTSPQSREGLRKVCVALLQSREGLISPLLDGKCRRMRQRGAVGI